MDFAEVLFVEFDVDAHLLRNPYRLRNPRIVDIQTDRAADEREIRTVPAVRGRQRRMQVEADSHGILIQDLARDTAEPRRARRVRAGRTDHHRSHDIQNRDFAVMPNGHSGPQLSCRTLQIPNCPFCNERKASHPRR